MMELASWMENDLVQVLYPHILKNSPNTYAYTKCLSEHLVAEYASKIKIAIARPSIGNKLTTQLDQCLHLYGSFPYYLLLFVCSDARLERTDSRLA